MIETQNIYIVYDKSHGLQSTLCTLLLCTLCTLCFPSFNLVQPCLLTRIQIKSAQHSVTEEILIYDFYRIISPLSISLNAF